MRYVVRALGKRGPRHLRAALNIGLGCVLLSGCSSSSDRFSSFSSDTGSRNGPAAALANATPGTRPAAVPASYPPPQGGLQTASAQAPSSGGYMQVSRVDLPPLAQPGQSEPRVRTADGYGPYNQPPASDEGYTGPRVFMPYDRPQDPPSPPPYRPESGPRYDDRDRESPPTAPTPGFYPRSEEGPPPYDGRPRPQAYEPFPDRERQGPPPRDRREGIVIRVAPGDTLYALARRYGVTVDMIVRANGLTSTHVRPGTELVIPRADPTSYEGPRPGAAVPQTATCTGERCHIVKPGETLRSIARAYGVPEERIAVANNLPNARALKAGQSITIPSIAEPPRRAVATANPSNDDRTAALRTEKAPPSPPPSPQDSDPKPSALKTPQPAKPGTQVSTATAQPTPEPTCEAALSNPLPRMGSTFRRPVEGKTIAQFGQQRDGTVNEGITISAPKGTQIKAAENGVVAYVGDELPGFGNLILIRHADEYVTAYAHADTILVKKCDIVKRGQPVATVGTTGDANQPQLHFEIRKNSKPVDPTPLLGS